MNRLYFLYQAYDDYWDRDATGWHLRTNGVPINFAARVEASLRPPLDIVQSGDNVIVSWAGPFILMSSTNVAGPYLDVSGATNPIGP